MAAICDFCYRGQGYGHAVSHAKNRVARVFKPNLQQLKVLLNGKAIRVKLCTSCIQRMKKDNHLGTLRPLTAKVVTKVKAPSAKSIAAAQSEIDRYLKESGITAAAETMKKEKAKKVKESVDIDAIVGKKK